jgi:hypothetical protein
MEVRRDGPFAVKEDQDMSTLLYSFKIKSKRDVLLARLRARQLSRILGYGEGDQLLLAAAAFELAWGTYQSRGRVVLHFTLEDERLRIACARPESKEDEEERQAFDRGWYGPQVAKRKAKQKGPDTLSELALRLEKPLPTRSREMTPEDVTWTMTQLARHTPLNLFEEIRQYNLDLLRLASEQRGQRVEMESPRRAGTAA